MGRSGGRGGGFRGGGFSGGRRSSGGFSGGRRSGRSYSGRSAWSGAFGGPRPIRSGPIFINNSRRYYGGSHYRGRGGGFGAAVAAVVAVLVVVMALFAYMQASSGGSGGSVQASTYAREPLPASAVTETAYYTDEAGWFSNPAQLEEGMRQFYRETGVQPYLYLLPNGSVTSVSALTDLAEELYPQLFTDEGHFLLVFCDDGYGSYHCGYTVGAQAKTVMDEEAIAILADYLDRYYSDYSIREEEVFSNAFAATGERIMTVTKSPLAVAAMCGAAVIVAVLVFILLRKRQEQRERERRRTEEILKTPLEKFGDQDAEDLADKYEEQENSST